MIFLPEPYVDVEEPYSEYHDTMLGLINCTVYPVHIGHHLEAQIHLHQLAEPAAIDQSMLLEVVHDSGLLPRGWSATHTSWSIADHPGILVNATSPDNRMVRVAGFSPDAEGGNPRFICLVRSDLRWNCTRALLESMRVMSGS